MQLYSLKILEGHDLSAVNADKLWTSLKMPNRVSLSSASHLAKGKKKVCPFFMSLDFDQRPVH